MKMLEKHLMELSEILKTEPKATLGIREVIDILLDVKTDGVQNEFIVDGDELTKYFGTKRKTPVFGSRSEFNEGLA